MSAIEDRLAAVERQLRFQRAVVVGLLVAALLSALLLPSSSPAAVDDWWQVATERLNVYANPNSQSKVIYTLKRGQLIQEWDAKANGWVLIRPNEKTDWKRGWVSRDSLDRVRADATDADDTTSALAQFTSAVGSAIRGVVSAVFGSILMIILMIGALALYLLPTFIAFRRKHPNAVAICLLDLLAGWTALGWLVALVWSATAIRKE